MGRLHEPTTARAPGHAAGPLEVVGVVIAVLAAWFALLGWDWADRPGASGAIAYAQTTVDWIVFGLIAMLGVGWLALRGRGTIGTIAVTVPVILLSGWRLAASGVTGWPVGLASLVFSLSLTCMMTAVLGAWLRRVSARRVAPRRGVGARP
jgi:hypothetical protein